MCAVPDCYTLRCPRLSSSGLRPQKGTGQATGGPVTGFAGRYHIRYFDTKGHAIADRELDIQKRTMRTN
jgi:hypothetical protein